MQTVHDLLRRAAKRFPEALAIIDNSCEIRLSYADLLDRIDRAAAGFAQHGVQSGDRVAVILNNSLDGIIAILGLHRANAIPAFLNPRLKLSELIELIRNTLVSAVVASHDTCGLDDLRAYTTRNLTFTVGGSGSNDVATLQNLKAHPPRFCACQEAAAFIFFTSGTSGVPKGVVIPHKATESRVLFMCTQVGYRHGIHNRVLGAMPVFHVVGFFAVLVATLSLNGTYVLISNFDPAQVLNLIEVEAITGIFLTPTHLSALVTEPAIHSARLDSLRHVTFAGSTIADSLLEKVNSHFPGEKVNIYGTTETMNSLYARSPTEGATFRPGYASAVDVASGSGSPIDFLPIGYEGELVVATDCDSATFTEYFNQPKLTSERLSEGWYRTGDAALKLASGEFALLGRIDDMIISGGENIHPTEVEQIVAGHPWVVEVAVIGIADEKWGQRVVACVVSRENDAVSAIELELHCKQSRLANFKRPKEYIFLDSLPKNSMNKVLRRQLAVSVNGATSRRFGM